MRNAPVSTPMHGARAGERPARVAVIGAGLAGLAAAAALAEGGCVVELFEARRQLGGRATSFRDPQTGETIDHCQHVSMGCCTNLADFCRRIGIEQLFRRDAALHFFGTDGRRRDFGATSWLPVPLHLGPGLWALDFLSRGERWAIARAMWRLAREPVADTPQGPTIGEWLRQQGQPPRAIEQFWSVVLVSALSETVDRASLYYARKVFVDGFMSHRRGYVVEVPRAPLGMLYGEQLEGWLSAHGVRIHRGATVRRLARDQAGIEALESDEGGWQEFDFFVVAVAWRRALELLGPALLHELPEVARAAELEAAPITGVHLWFDRAITNLPHAVLVGRLSQWLFARSARQGEPALPVNEHYYQVVISASREISGHEREQVVDRVREELEGIFPAARAARLLRWRVVTQQEAVFSVRPGVAELRPEQQTAIANLILAGDWTATDWPATMEGAVRSGYLAAEAVLKSVGRPQRVLVWDLPRAPLARAFLRR